MQASRSYEPLERRVLMAGDVIVFGAEYESVTGSDGQVHLVRTAAILGDGADNRIQVYSRPVAEGPGTTELVVVGLDGTTVNGASEFVLNASLNDGTGPNFTAANPSVPDFLGADVTVGDIHISLGDGDDFLDVSGLSDLGPRGPGLENAEFRLVVRGGFGNDVLSLANIDLPHHDVEVWQPRDGEGGPEQPSLPDDDVLSAGVREGGTFHARRLLVVDEIGDSQVYVTDVTLDAPPIADYVGGHLSVYQASSADSAAGRVFDRSAVAYLADVRAAGRVSLAQAHAARQTAVLVGVTADDVVLIQNRGGVSDAELHDVHAGEIGVQFNSREQGVTVVGSTAGTLSFWEFGGGDATVGVFDTTVTDRVFAGTYAASDWVFSSDGLVLTGDAASLEVVLGFGDNVFYMVGGGLLGANATATFSSFDGNNRIGLNGVDFGNAATVVNGGAADDAFSAGNGALRVAFIRGRRGGQRPLPE